MREDWPKHDLRLGDIVAFDFEALCGSPDSPMPQLVFRPSALQVVEHAACTKSTLILSLLDNARNTVLTSGFETWDFQPFDVPSLDCVYTYGSSRQHDRCFVGTEGFLTPSSLWLADARSREAILLKTSPPRFDAAGLAVHQWEAVSRDGTIIPYFIVAPG